MNETKPSISQDKPASDEKFKVVAPTGIKKIGIYLVNFLIFIAYWLVLQFIIGFIVGFTEGLGLIPETIFENDAIWSYIGLATLAIVAVATLIFRGKIYLKLEKK